ncbi:hypothetical protein [Arthrobacter sp. ES1]|uniref:hypothetical protein n=1 Tax=Arthrobacter sp. ES1 TaxID=1897056 RepID=UPI001CFFE212|nr:hypothetical protein [Arthrobacter sp. ES1]MCB5280313.1 hypothetical protein [Arthrobacter sp. ES1]
MSKPFTVIGYWDGNRPVSVGVVEGEHQVNAGEGVTEEGDWAMAIEADSPEAAESLAIAEMRANDEAEGLGDEDADYDDSQDYDTNEEGAQL